MWPRGWPLRSVLTSGAGGGILTIIFILHIWSFGNSCYSPLPPGMDLFLCRPSSQAWSFSHCIIANIILTASLPPLINKTPQTVQLGILSPQSSKSDQVHFQWQLHPLSTSFLRPTVGSSHASSPRAWPAPLPSSEQPPKVTSTQDLISKCTTSASSSEYLMHLCVFNV